MIYLLYFATVFMLTTFLTQRKQALMLVSLLTFLFIALSYPSGNDWIGYFINYDCLINNNCRSGFIMFEPGYELIVSLVGVFGYQAIIIFIALMNVLLIYRFAQLFENGAFVITAIMCMFLWSVYIEAIRQAVAFSILLYSILPLLRGEIKKYIVLIIIASTFHITALVCFLFVIPIYSVKISKIMSYSLLIFGGVFFAAADKILSFAVNILPLGTIASEKLQFYLNSEQYKPQLSIGSGTLLDVILICLIVLSLRNMKKNNHAQSHFFNHILLLGICLYISFALLIGKMMPVMTRVGWYGFPFVIICLYSKIGDSVFYKAYKSASAPRISLNNFIVVMFFLLQIIRPFIYEHSNYNILHQETIFQNLNLLDDDSLRSAAKEKCYILSKMGYGYLCTL